MKTPKEIIRYRNLVIDTLKWAVENGHINEEQEEILASNILDIEIELYPKETVVDENGWTQIKSRYIDGLPIDEWE